MSFYRFLSSRNPYGYVEETAVAKGIRRIAATTGILAQRILQHSNQVLADAVDLQRDVQQLSSAKQIDQVYKRMKTITPIHGTFCTSHTCTLDNPYARLINTGLIDLCLCLQIQLAQFEERLGRLRQMLDQGTQNSEDNVDRYTDAQFKNSDSKPYDFTVREF